MKTKLLFLSIFIVITLLSNAQPTDNVVAYYPFNGNANDVSKNGNNGTLANATLTIDRLGKTNAAYSFNGTNAMIYLPNLLLPGNMAYSISCWIKINGNRTVNDGYFSQQIVDFRGQYNTNLVYCQSDNPTYHSSIVFNAANTTSNTFCSSPDNSIQFGTWYHIVASYGNNTMQLYVNGILVDTKTQTPPNVVTGYNNTIGKDYNMGRDRMWFNGLIDEILIYKRSLTATEVQAIYNRGLTQSEIPELFGSVYFGYDLAGNRTWRNVISLKSSKIINERKDTAMLFNPQSELNNDSLRYTDLNQQIKIYPNPTRGILQTDIRDIDFTKPSGIYVYSPSGTLLQQHVPARASDVIDLSAYPNGIYIVRIVLGDKESVWKILKE